MNLFIGLSLLFALGCTDLDEEIFDELSVEEYGKTDKEINSLIGPIWSDLRQYPDYYSTLEVSSDMSVTPTRKGGDWWDGGAYKEMRLHTWTPSNSRTRRVYRDLSSRISRCNQILFMVENSEGIEDKEPVIAQIRAARAFWYYVFVDNYGNVPLVTDFTDVSLPSTTPRKEVYEWVLSELNDIKDVIRDDVSSSSYGKFTKGAVYSILAKMYLNAMVWNPDGGPKWQECIDACDEVLNLPYSLVTNWKDNFIVKNEGSPEAILSVVYSLTSPWGIVRASLHYLDKIALELNMNASNGISAQPSYVKSFDPDDKRIGWSFLIGPMIDPATGNTIITAHNRPLIHTIDITMVYAFDAEGWGQTEQEDGVRCFKWEIPKGLSARGVESDVFIFRLADIYLMKAEAIVRSGGDNLEATALVNAIRERAFDDPAKLYTSVTLNDIYMERRFEFAWELMGRQDQIRFGTFLDPIPDWKPYVSNDRCLLFPIPTDVLDANSNLDQNPGY